MRVAAAAVATAAAVTALTALPATAAAPFIEHVTETFVDPPFDCDGTLVQDSGTVQIFYKLGERGTSPIPFVTFHVHATIVHTNLETGGTYTEVIRNNFADHIQVDNGDGTVTFTVRLSGSARFYDQFGNFVLKDPGTLWFSSVWDYNGTPGDIDDDVEIPGSFEIVKPNTGHSDSSDRNFCDDLRTYTSAP